MLPHQPLRCRLEQTTSLRCDNGFTVQVGQRSNRSADTGAVIVDDGSRISTSGLNNLFALGDPVGSDARLSVESGGSILTLYLRVALEGFAVVTVTGPMSTITASTDTGEFGANDAGEGAFVDIGRGPGGHGILRVLDGGTVEVRPGLPYSGTERYPSTTLQTGRFQGGLGEVFIDGAGSLIDISGPRPFFDVGRECSGRAEISYRAQIRVRGSDAEVRVSGNDPGVIDPALEPRRGICSFEARASCGLRATERVSRWGAPNAMTDRYS